MSTTYKLLLSALKKCRIYFNWASCTPVASGCCFFLKQEQSRLGETCTRYNAAGSVVTDREGNRKGEKFQGKFFVFFPVLLQYS